MQIKRRCLPKQAPRTAWMLILIVIFTAGCPPKLVQVAVTENDKRHAEEAAREGDVAFSRKDYYAALIKYLESSRYNPNNSVLLNRLGITYSLLNFYDPAATAFSRSIQLDPKFPYAYNNLGSVYFAQGNLRKAEKYFKKAIGIKENDASFHMNMGSLYMEKKKYDKAMAEWRKGLALDPQVFTRSSAVSLTGGGGSGSLRNRYFYLARLFASAGNVESALENLKLAVTNGFSDLDAIKNQPDFDPIRKDTRFVKFMEEAPILIKLRANMGLLEATPPVARRKPN